MTAATKVRKKLWTEEELQALPEDGYIHEVVDGELVMSPKNNYQRESICGRLFAALYDFNRTQRLGVVRGSSARHWMFNRNCRAPDISFRPKARLEKPGFKPMSKKFFPGAPDLAVEILSPNNTRQERSTAACETSLQVARKSPGLSIRRPRAPKFATL